MSFNQELKMFTPRPGSERGHFDHGWLETYHSFSFGEYFDPNHHSFRTLRVMNEDFVAGGAGFPKHPHRDMEIVTYVLSGALTHEDSLGNREVLRAGEFQRMTAGSGIFHSEFNAEKEPVHLYQIWLFPNAKGLTPGYEQKPVNLDQAKNQFRLVATPDARDGSLKINQDATISLSRIDASQTVDYAFNLARHGWLQVIDGEITVGNHQLKAGDGLAISDEASLAILARSNAEVMLFDLA
jgi:quercetin 2,3-dioxygenase